MRSANFLGPVCVFALPLLRRGLRRDQECRIFRSGASGATGIHPASAWSLQSGMDRHERERSMSRSCSMARLSRASERRKSEGAPGESFPLQRRHGEKLCPITPTGSRRSNLAVTRTRWYSLEERASGRHEGKETGPRGPAAS